MGIKEIWNEIEAVVVKRGFTVVDSMDVQQGRRCVIRVIEIPSDQPTRGTLAASVVRLTFSISISLCYDWGGDARIERVMAEDAEDMILAICTDVKLANQKFVGATIERDPTKSIVVDNLRFDFQSQTS
jgi:hypothetical protein